MAEDTIATIEIEDPVTQTKVSVPKELSVLIGHMTSIERKNTESKVKAKYEPIMEKLREYENQVPELTAKLEELREASMSGDEKLKSQAERLTKEWQKKHETALNEAGQWKDRYMQGRLKTDIYGAFGDVKLCNPEQTALVFMSEGKAQVRDIIGADGKPTGDFETVVSLDFVKDGKTETKTGKPAELFKEWINLDRNLHHQMNNLAPGGGSHAGKDGNGKARMKREEFDALPPAAKVKAMQAGTQLYD